MGWGSWYPTLRQKEGEGWGTHFLGMGKGVVREGLGLCFPTLRQKEGEEWGTHFLGMGKGVVRERLGSCYLTLRQKEGEGWGTPICGGFRKGEPALEDSHSSPEKCEGWGTQ